MTRFLIKKLIFLSCVFSLAFSCREDVSTPPIGYDIANPISLASDSTGSYFYVLNSDFLHKYDSGSILVIDHNGEKVGVRTIPRLGKILNVNGDHLLVAFDRESGDESSKVLLLNIKEDPKNPKQIHEWDLEDCSPLNIVSRKDYNYFALSCQEGDLYIGTYDTKSMKKIRTYPQVRYSNRRAMYLDPKRELLFLFVSDDQTGINITDDTALDKETWVEGKKTDDKPDEIPDVLQRDGTVDIDNNTSRFQFMLVDLAAERQADFPHREYKDVRKAEARWLHFKLKNFDGAPDNASIQGDPDTKYYRTNFWDAQPDPEDPNSFYLSHRGLGTVNHSEQANDLIKVSFHPGGNPRVTDGIVPKLDSYMAFKRVYGFKGDETGKDKYFNSFKIVSFSGRKAVLMNSFRDLSNFSDPRYSIAAANLLTGHEPVEWFAQASSKDNSDSYWDLALGKDGNLLTIAFFSETLKLFKVKYGETITLNKSIE